MWDGGVARPLWPGLALDLRLSTFCSSLPSVSSKLGSHPILAPISCALPPQGPCTCPLLGPAWWISLSSPPQIQGLKDKVALVASAPILQLGTLRSREVKCLAQGHTASKGWSRNPNLVCLTHSECSLNAATLTVQVLGAGAALTQALRAQKALAP